MTGQGSWIRSGVQFDGPDASPWTFWTTTPLEVFSQLAALNYPVQKPYR